MNVLLRFCQKLRANPADEYDVETSSFSSLELLLARGRYEFEYVRLVANLLELVPIRDEEERQIVLKAVNYYGEGMTAFDAFHAATADTWTLNVLPSEKDYEDIKVERVPVEPADE